jgi:hypothetical protein
MNRPVLVAPLAPPDGRPAASRKLGTDLGSTGDQESPPARPPSSLLRTRDKESDPPSARLPQPQLLLWLGDLAPSHHRDSDGNRLKVRRQSIGLINNLPSRKRTVRSCFEPNALLTGREYYTVSALIFALDQTSEDGLGRWRPSSIQCIAKICETVCVTQQVGKLPNFLLEQLFRRVPNCHLRNPIP